MVAESRTEDEQPRLRVDDKGTVYTASVQEEDPTQLLARFVHYLRARQSHEALLEVDSDAAGRYLRRIPEMFRPTSARQWGELVAILPRWQQVLGGWEGVTTFIKRCTKDLKLGLIGTFSVQDTQAAFLVTVAEGIPVGPRHGGNLRDGPRDPRKKSKVCTHFNSKRGCKFAEKLCHGKHKCAKCGGTSHGEADCRK